MLEVLAFLLGIGLGIYFERKRNKLEAKE